MPGKSWRSVELGQGQVCAIADDGALYCWGRNPEGETGLGSELPQIRIPTRVGIESDWVSIAASQHHSCGVRGDGTLWCWGKNPYLEIGAADATRSFLIPTQVGTDVDWAEVGAGWFHGCALKRDGRLSCWGRAIEGQLGQGGGNPVRVPTRVAMPMQWQRIALGGFDTCGVDDTGSLYCWGAGPDGELGLGDVLRISEPVRVR
jgi:alpha-tubulin suppressor-like RCC1 family protein